MPVKSAKQFRLMEAAAHGADYGPSEGVAKEFLKKTPNKTKSNFAKGKKKFAFGKKSE
jgi:uncharacterized protein (DUF427 family)